MGKRKAKVLVAEKKGHKDEDHFATSESHNGCAMPLNDVKGGKNEEDIMVIKPCLSGCLPNSSVKRSKMDDRTFDNLLENIWKSFSEDKRGEFAYLDSMYFRYYQKKGTQALELRKREDIFSKKYVFVPIVCWDHWRLVIFCHFGQSVHSEIRTRCILLLDSVQMSANLIEPVVRKFVFDVFTTQDRPESKDVIYQIPVLMPKVPQQTNDVDCGRFVLYFIKLFMNAAPENFNKSDGYPYFLKPDWFDPEGFAKFCDKLDEETPIVKQGAEQVRRRFSQRVRTTRGVCTRKSFRHVTPQDEAVVMIDDPQTSS